MTRAEKVTEAQRLRAEGLKLREVAERMGSTVSTVGGWLADPDSAKLRARKESYRGRCIDCGKPTDGSNGPGNAPTRCLYCRAARLADEGRARYVREIRRFAAMYGRPPVAADWNPAEARAKCAPGHADEIAARYERDGWPSSDGARKAFGTWNAAVLAAGFSPRASGERGPDWHQTPEAQAEAA